jgi:hypothetical protein
VILADSDAILAILQYRVILAIPAIPADSEATPAACASCIRVKKQHATMPKIAAVWIIADL